MKTKTVKKNKKTSPGRKAPLITRKSPATKDIKEVICSNCGEKVSADRCHNLDDEFICYDCGEDKGECIVGKIATNPFAGQKVPVQPLNIPLTKRNKESIEDPKIALEAWKKVFAKPIFEIDVDHKKFPNTPAGRKDKAETIKEALEIIINDHGNNPNRHSETSYKKFINEQCGKRVEDANEFYKRKAIRHIMNEKIEKKKTLEENQDYRHGRKMKGRHPESIDAFSHILDNIVKDIMKEGKKPTKREVSLSLRKRQDNYKNVYSVDLEKKIHLKNNEKPIPDKTLLNRITASKTRCEYLSKK